MGLRTAAAFLAAVELMIPGCGGGSPSDPGDPEPPAVASVRIIAGDAQTDTAGAVLATAIVIEVLDVNGQGSPARTIVLSKAGSEPALSYQTENPSGDVVTDSSGRAQIRWRIYGLAGTRHLIASVLGSAVVGRDTIAATVLPASPSQVQYVEPEIHRLIGEPADLAANIVSVTDSWGNPVAVQTVTVEAPSPVEVTGETTVLSHEEIDTGVTLRINGVAFLLHLVVLRSIQEFIGAVGDWTCSSDPGAPSTGQYLRSQVGHFLVDSITRYGDYGSDWTLHLSTTLHQTFADGETRTEGPFYEQRYLELQVPHGFAFPYGPAMEQTGTNPIKYTELFGASECIAWSGPSSHVPLTITLTQ